MIGFKQLPLLIGLILTFIYGAQAQDGIKPVAAKNTVYFEVLGNGYLYSINYERSFLTTPKVSYSARVGYSGFNFMTGIGSESGFRFFPLTLNMIRHYNRNNLEIGIGVANELSDEGEKKRVYYFIPTLHTGYRRYMKHNLDFRAGINFSRADLNPDDNYEVLPWPYLSIGKKF